MQRPLFTVVGPLAILLAGLSISSCARSQAEPVSRSARSDAPTVAVATVETADLTRALVLTAEFKPNQEVDVMAKVAGYIKKIYVDVGDRVEANQVLATLEIPEMGDDLKRAQAAVVRSQAEVARANDELTRAEAAHQIADLSFQRLSAVLDKKPGLIAQQEIDDAHSKDLVAEAQVSAAKSALAVAREQVQVNLAESRKVETLIAYTRVTAPFAGVVTKRFADTGSMIQAGTASQTQAMPVVRISENSTLRLIVPVPESAVPGVHVGQQVEVRVPTLNRSFPGQVARFADKVAPATRTMDTEVDVPNPNRILIPGMYAEVDLTTARRNRVLAIPVMAVDMGGDDAGRVMVITPNNRVETRRIALGLETAHRVEVRSGLNEGDMVVLSGRPALQPGQEVRPKATTLTGAAAEDR
jgi:RND family efflux transporter MFP subunit